jgi:hypothetical protein
MGYVPVGYGREPLGYGYTLQRGTWDLYTSTRCNSNLIVNFNSSPYCSGTGYYSGDSSCYPRNFGVYTCGYPINPYYNNSAARVAAAGAGGFAFGLLTGFALSAFC